LAGVNYYFGDKEKLYIQTVKRAQQISAAQVPMPDAARSGFPEERLRVFVRTLLKRMVGIDEAAWQSKLMMREVLQPTRACREMVEEYFQPEFDLLLDILDGLLPRRTPAHRRQQIGFSVIGQCLFYRVAGGVVGMLIPPDQRQKYYSVEQLSEHVSWIVLAALGKRPLLPSICQRSEADGVD
jgi:AcrR family transcriptional regulator